MTNLFLFHGSTVLLAPAIVFFIVGFLLLGFLARRSRPTAGAGWGVSALFAVVFFCAGLVCLLIALDELWYWVKYSLER